MTTFQNVCSDRCRGLTSGELSMIHGVFQNALTLSAIHIHDHPYNEKHADNPHTIGNDVFMPDDSNNSIYVNYYSDYTKAPIYQQAVLIHELTHVWQNQTGRRGSVPMNVARNAIKGKDYPTALAEYVEEQSSKTGRRRTHDVLGRSLSWNTNPVVRLGTGTEIMHTELAGGKRQSVTANDRQGEVRLSEQYANTHHVNEKRLQDDLQDRADYDYLYSPIDWRDGAKAFDGLNSECQAEMIKDYFLLKKGIDPASPQACNPAGFRMTPPTVKPRPRIAVYELVIPFLRGAS